MSNLIQNWKERIAFNEAYDNRRITSAQQAGRDSYDLGIDKKAGRSSYFDSKDQRFSEAKEFLSSEDSEPIYREYSNGDRAIALYDDLGDSSNDEDPLGMSSVVANETDDLGDLDWQQDDNGEYYIAHDDGGEIDWQQDDDGHYYVA